MIAQRVVWLRTVPTPLTAVYLGTVCTLLVVAAISLVAMAPAAVPRAATELARAQSRLSHPVAARTAIVGGSLATGPAFASLAFIRDVRGEGVGACTGTVVAPNAVLTAGHCAENPLTGVVNPASGYSVLTHSTNLDSPEVEVSAVTRVIVDPAFDFVRSTAYDAALLVLSIPTSAPAIALLTRASSVKAGARGVVAGWGLTAYSNVAGPETRLRRATMILQGSTWCNHHTEEFAAKSEICTIHPPGHKDGTCKGDSGAPLLLGRAEVGIGSRGSPTCSTAQPGVFTSIPAVSAWLRGAITEATVSSYRQLRGALIRPGPHATLSQ